MAHEIECPYTERELTKREQVWYWRKRSAWFLAEKLGDVTQESYDKAFSLLNRCKNASLGLYNADHEENELNWRRVDAKRERLNRRVEALNEELRPYGCRMVRASGIHDVYDYDFERHVPEGTHYLHFFN